MATFAFGPLLMLLLSGGGGSDLVSMLNAEDYFRTRGIETRVEKMMELASKAPADSKAGVQQLLALRVLGENADKLKSSKEFGAYREMLTQIAAGKKAQDKLGFAREYATWTLSRVGVPLPAAKPNPVHKLQESALDWFPNKLSLAAALEVRGGGSFDPGDKNLRSLFDALDKQIPRAEKDKIYTAIEKLGNVRVDRVSLGFLSDPDDTRKGRLFVRLTGKADHRQLVELLKSGLVVDELKGNEKEPPIAMGHSLNSGPALAVIGDHDFVIADNFEVKQNRLDTLKQVLAVRAGKESSVLKGPLGDELKKVSDKAQGFVVGKLPENLLNELTMPRGPFAVVPANIFVEAQTQGDKLALQLRGKLKNPDEAKSFCNSIDQLRAKGLEALAKLPPNQPFPFDLAEVKQILKNIKAEFKGDTATVSLQAPRNVLGSIIAGFYTARAGAIDRATDPGKARPPLQPRPKE